MSLQNVHKIVILLPNNSLGGAEQYLRMIAENYVSEEVKVFFLQKLNNSKEWENPSDRVTKIYLSNSSKIIGLLKLFWKFLLKPETTYIVFTSHVFINGIAGLFIRLGLLKTKYFVARESTSIFKRFKGIKLLSYKLAYKLGYGKIDLLICQTEDMKSQLLKGLPWLDKKKIKIAVLHNPIDLKLIEKKENDPVQDDIRENSLVSAGRLIPEKGFDILIIAFSKIYRDSPNLSLTILGEGPERGKLEALIEKNNLNAKVFLPGRVSNVYPYFKKAKLCVVSSRIEGFPNVLLQMMSQNEKVVSTLCAGGIENLRGIITAKTNDVDQLVEAIRKSLNSRVSNRIVFDELLNLRNIDSFVSEIHAHLEIPNTNQ